MARPLPPINAARSPATVVPLTFPIPCWLSVRVYQRESEAPLKSLFPFVTFSEDPMVKEGMNAGASHMELPPPRYEDNERSVMSRKLAKRGP